MQRDEFEQDATSLQVGDVVRYRPDGLIQRLRDRPGEVIDLDYNGSGSMIAVRFMTEDGKTEIAGCYQTNLIKLAPARN